MMRQVSRPGGPGWYWLKMNGVLEIVKVFEYRVKPGAVIELEVSRTGHQYTAPVSDGLFIGARWFGPLCPPGEA
jgi:hypothetical protein